MRPGIPTRLRRSASERPEMIIIRTVEYVASFVSVRLSPGSKTACVGSETRGDSVPSKSRKRKRPFVPPIFDKFLIENKFIAFLFLFFFQNITQQGGRSNDLNMRIRLRKIPGLYVCLHINVFG